MQIEMEERRLDGDEPRARNPLLLEPMLRLLRSNPCSISGLDIGRRVRRVSGVGGRAGAVEVAVAVRDDGCDLARSVRCGEAGAEPACDEGATDPGRED